MQSLSCCFTDIVFVCATGGINQVILTGHAVGSICSSLPSNPSLNSGTMSILLFGENNESDLLFPYFFQYSTDLHQT